MPSVSIRSSVAAMSRIDLTPAETTVIGTSDSTLRSADSSKLCSGAAVDAAQTAGGEDPDAGVVGDERRRCDGGGTAAAARQHDREVAHAQLGQVLGGDALQLVIGEPGLELAVEHRDGGGHDVGFDQQLLEPSGSGEVLWLRQSVRDDRRLQRNDRQTRREGVSDLR